MAKCLIGPTGGLSAADKETVRQWMVAGHSVQNGKVAGTIPSKAAATYTPKTTAQTIAAGQYLSGAQTIKGDANLKAANIKEGVTVFGVTGTLAPFGKNRLVSDYNGAWLGSNSRATWTFANTDGSIVCGAGEDHSNTWTVDFDGTVSVVLSGHNQCRVNGAAKTGTFSVKKGDTIYWWGNQGSSYLVQKN